MSNRLRYVFLAVLLSVCASVGRAQEASRARQVDIFMGLDFNCRDIYWNNRVFDVLINLTPGVRWNMGHRWEIAAQAYIPIINQFGKSYGKVRPRVVSVSKQLAVFNRWKMKFSGGIFTADSYGLDWKNMVVVNKWLAVTAQFGLTGYFSIADGWHASVMKKFTFMVGPEFYLQRWNTQFSLRGGRYLFNDFGVEAEAYRHFKHVSVGAFASYNNLDHENAGFKVIVMLPPYRQKRRKVNFRPASNFRLRYSYEASSEGMRRYMTDPEENERTGWFDPDLIPWGSDFLRNKETSPLHSPQGREPAHSTVKSMRNDSASLAGKEVAL